MSSARSSRAASFLSSWVVRPLAQGSEDPPVRVSPAVHGRRAAGLVLGSYRSPVQRACRCLWPSPLEFAREFRGLGGQIGRKLCWDGAAPTPHVALGVGTQRQGADAAGAPGGARAGSRTPARALRREPPLCFSNVPLKPGRTCFGS